MEVNGMDQRKNPGLVFLRTTWRRLERVCLNLTGVSRLRASMSRSALSLTVNTPVRLGLATFAVSARVPLHRPLFGFGISPGEIVSLGPLRNSYDSIDKFLSECLRQEFVDGSTINEFSPCLVIL
jgi:hypothetical protein